MIIELDTEELRLRMYLPKQLIYMISMKTVLMNVMLYLEARLRLPHIKV